MLVKSAHTKAFMSAFSPIKSSPNFVVLQILAPQ